MQALPVEPVFVIDLLPSPNQSLTSSEYLPESPIYRPRTSFSSVEGSKYCGQDTLELLYNMEDLFTKLLERSQNGLSSETCYQNCLRATYSRIFTIPPATQIRTTPTDACYEATRLCTAITLHAMINSRGIFHTPLELSKQLIVLLKATNIGNAWGDMLGVLYWIAITGTAACPEGPEHLFFDGLLGKCQFAVAYSTSRPEARILPALRFSGVHLAIVQGPVKEMVIEAGDVACVESGPS